MKPSPLIPEPRLGLALSGGGFRAAAFHLGVLKRLQELGLLQRIESMSTVSGGSITGGLYALRCAQAGGAPGCYPVDDLIAEMRPFLLDNLRARALFGTPGRAFRTVWSFASPRVSRIGLMVDELDRQLFKGATLDQLPAWIVVNATNLRTGKAWKFFHDRAGDYLIGATDRTSTIRVAEAVAASAAYPGLTDSYGFVTRWEELRGDLLDEHRWERPPPPRAGAISRWRERFGQPSGEVTIPLADGGLYDNEGLNGLRGRKVTHAMISAVAPPESDHTRGFGIGRMLRIVAVIHDRLGNATRQLAHEMTHAIDPTAAARETADIAAELRAVAGAEGVPSSVGDRLEQLAIRTDVLTALGTPPRGPQFAASAQILLHSSNLARNQHAAPERGGLDVPAAYRGVDKPIVDELSRVRTDLDALEPRVLDLLIAQGYFLCDFQTKLSMPDLVFTEGGSAARYSGVMEPRWEVALAAVVSANANQKAVCEELGAAGAGGTLLGRVPNAGVLWRYRVMMGVAAVPVGIVAISALLLVWWVVGAVLGWLGVAR
jgi:NTE family protein